MMLTLRTHTTARSYLDAAYAWLATHEVEANLALGIALRLDKQSEAYPQPWYLATLHETDPSGASAASGERIVGAAVRTPPWHLVVHAEPGYEQALAEQVAEELLRRRFPPTGVNGRVPASDRFAREWTRRTGQGARLLTSLRAFRLDQVIPPQPAPGRLRPASSADSELVAAWLAAFDAEVLPGEVAHRTPESVQRLMDAGTVHLWEVDGRVVSLVNYGRPLATGITVAPVYTPPDARGRGYASNAVAQLSQQLLDAGYLFVSLFTDQSNPTSNKIYQAVGYRPVCDYADYAFAGELDAASAA